MSKARDPADGVVLRKSQADANSLLIKLLASQRACTPSRTAHQAARAHAAVSHNYLASTLVRTSLLTVLGLTAVMIGLRHSHTHTYLVVPAV